MAEASFAGGQTTEASNPVVDIGDVMQKMAEHKGCGTEGGSGKASCGSSAGPADMPPEIWEKVKNHPCYSEEAHHHYARMHVAVAPACNIQCNYCNRKYDCANESRPGVVSERLTPEQASKKVLAVASTIPQMTVLGIAGTGDSAAYGASLLFVYSLGLGLPFLIAALFADPFMRWMKRMRRHMGKVEMVMGGLLVITGILFITGQMTQFSSWLLQTFPGLQSIG